MVVPGSMPNIIRSFANFIYFCRMFTPSRKAKQFLVLTAKLLIVGGAFYFIYDRIAENNNLDWSRLTDAVTRKNSAWIVVVIILLSFLNRFIEILKWQNLIASFKKISPTQATDQVLASLTAGMFTPNGVGEYAAKALYYKKAQAKNIVFLNLICNGAQLIIAVLAGIIGLLLFNLKYGVIPDALFLLLLSGLIAIIIAVFLSRKITIKGYSLQKFFSNINEVPKQIHQKNLFLALARYLCIIHQHYFIFLLFDVHLPYPIMLSAITGIYFLGSSLPTFQFLDFAVRGSVAVFFFGLAGVNEWIVVFAATIQWLLNIVIPVALGSFYVFRFKTERNDEPENITLHQE